MVFFFFVFQGLVKQPEYAQLIPTLLKEKNKLIELIPLFQAQR